MSTSLKPVVGLFGTCGSSTWREDKVVPMLEAQDIASFNPVVKDWNEACMKVEAEHAASDQVILMIITGETTAIGSLAESGWIALEAVANGQKIVLYIEDMPVEKCPAKDEFGGALTPNKTRKLVRSHLAKVVEAYPTSVFLTTSVEDATAIVIELMKKS
jgi:hypothetical protein